MARLGKITVGVVWQPSAKAENVYIGRGTKNASPLGNPFIIGPEYTREEACAKYETYLRDAVKTNPAVKAELTRIAKLIMLGVDVNLNCYCKGKEVKQCHGDFLKTFIEAAVRKKLTKKVYG